MAGTKAVCAIGLLVSFVVGGCASASLASSDGAAVVLDYPSRTAAEATARGMVLEADDQARQEIEKNVAEARRNARPQSRAQTGTSDAQELSEEDVAALRAEAEAAKRKMWMPLYEQIDRYDRFLQEYPGNWYVRHRFAWFLSDMLMNEYAAEEWERVIELEPRFPYAYNNLATLYNHVGRDKESIVLFRKAIELKGDDPAFWTNLAVNYSTHRAEAMELYGWDLPRTFQECLNAYRRARELDPKNVEIARDLATQFILAKYFNVTNTADEALKEWDYYLGLDLDKNQRIFGLLNVGRIYLREKDDPETAVRWLGQALALDETHLAARAVMESAQKALSERDVGSEEKETE